MEGVEVGLVYEDRMIVGPGQAASLLIPGLPEVLATASLVAFVQLAAAKAVAGYVQSGQGTVGTKITLAQLASTPVGMEVRAVVRLGGVNDRRLIFTFEAFDAVEKICEGTHERYVIDIEWLKRRLEQKLQKVS
jgi:predicted thioesterase